MDKDEYLRLLCEASINDSTKFAHIDQHRPKSRGRPPKNFHPLLEKEKELHKKVHQILPKDTAQQLCPKGSRLAHLYGLPKTHKARLCMRPILSASDTYNYPLAKWLEEKLKPLSTNKYCISDIFDFTDEIRNITSNLTTSSYLTMCLHYLPMFLLKKPLAFSLTKLSTTTGLMRRTACNSKSNN